MEACVGLECVWINVRMSFFSFAFIDFLSFFAILLDLFIIEGKLRLVWKKKKNWTFPPVSANVLSATQGNVFFPRKLRPCCFPILCCFHYDLHEKCVCGENDDPDPGGDDRRDGTVTLWGANVRCSRAAVWQQWRVCSTGWSLARFSSDSVQQLTQKDKVLWKGASQGSTRGGRGLSAPVVTLVPLQIGFVLVNEGEREEEKSYMGKRKKPTKQHCFGSCLDPQATTQATFVPKKPRLWPRVVMPFPPHPFVYYPFYFFLFLFICLFIYFAPGWHRPWMLTVNKSLVEGI